MSGYNDDSYGTSGTTGGLGSNTTATNPYGTSSSGLDSEVRRDDTTYGSSGLGSDSRRNDDYNSSTSGPHKSDMLNKMDPRVDSDNSKAYDSNASRDTADFGSSNTTSGYGDSGMANRVDDNSRFGSSGASGAYDSSNTGLGSTGSGYDNTSSNYGNSASGGFGTTGTTRGPHNTDTANVLDPNVDANRSGYGNTSGGLGSSGAYGSTNDGPHSSNLANKADPRVDSDNDRTRGPDSTRDNYGSSGFGSNTTSTGSGLGSGTDTYGSNTTSTGTGLGSGSDTYGSGTTAGSGYGNKSSDYNDSSNDGKKGDSTMGKIMEKAGSMLHKDNIVEKGREKREEAARSDNNNY